MSVKISELPSASSVGSNDVIPIVQNGTTKKVTAGILQNPTKNYMSIRNTSNITIASTGGWSSYQVKLTTIQYSNGSKFTLDDGAILIGAGVSKVKATLNMAIKGSSAETGTIIRKKASGEATWQGYYPTCNYKYADWFPTSTSVIIDVSEGDKIGAFLNTHTSGNLEINAVGAALLVEEYESSTVSTANTLNTTRLMNTGELVGMGDRAEITLDKEEQSEKISETKSAEVDKLESEERSGDNI